MQMKSTEERIERFGLVAKTMKELIKGSYRHCLQMPVRGTGGSDTFIGNAVLIAQGQIQGCFDELKNLGDEILEELAELEAQPEMKARFESNVLAFQRAMAEMVTLDDIEEVAAGFFAAADRKELSAQRQEGVSG